MTDHLHMEEVDCCENSVRPGLARQQHVQVQHDDACCMVVTKPAGLLCVPGRGPDKQDCLSSRVQRLHPDARIVHRLDMATSGLVLMARGDAMQRVLSQAFERREVRKRYLAVVAGRLPAAATEDGWQAIELPLSADWPRRPMQRVDVEAGRPSLTRWRVLGHGDGWTRLELEPVTGRTHQLRVHLQAIGHPILGDALYAPPAVQALAERLLLHAWRLRFAHPLDMHPVTVESPAPF
jgi:tRNA pseudouridine32 synthase / 23S rRNA pseudouridine746 synthase